MNDRDANLLILLADLGVLALTIKLYTEYFKDRSQIKIKSGNGAGHE